MSDGDNSGPDDPAATADQPPDATTDDQAEAGAGAPGRPGGPRDAWPGGGARVVEDPIASAADELAEADAEGTVDPMTALTVERDDYRDALIRLQADFENYKKRMLKQQTDNLERAAGNLVEKLLPVLDTADLALAHGSGEDVKQVAGTLSSVLEREGLERIDPLGTTFDPTLHDAVAHEPGEGGPEVVEVLRAGYRWKGKVLRPAMVKVRG